MMRKLSFSFSCSKGIRDRRESNCSETKADEDSTYIQSVLMKKKEVIIGLIKVVFRAKKMTLATQIVE